jgi:hypothetical protein
MRWGVLIACGWPLAVKYSYPNAPAATQPTPAMTQTDRRTIRRERLFGRAAGLAAF